METTKKSDEADPTLVPCPSFKMAVGNEASSSAPVADGSQATPASHQSLERGSTEGDESHDGEETCSEDDFEFAFVSHHGSEAGDTDEAPVYPVFNREVMFFHGYEESGEKKGVEEEERKVVRVPLRRMTVEEERDFLRSSEAAEEGNYCVWTPAPRSPEMPKKSKSTGNGSSHRWRLRDLVVGRSHSDGKEKLLFYTPTAPAQGTHAPTGSEKKKQSKAEEGKKEKGKGEMDMAKAHRLFYAKKVSGRDGDGQRRRVILPYRKDTVGLFGGMSGAHARFLPF